MNTGQTFQVVNSMGERPCTIPEIVRRLDLVKSADERYTPDREGHLKINIQFSKPVDQGTVVMGKTVIVDAPLDHSAPGTIIWVSGASDSLILIVDKPRRELFPSGPNDLDFILTLRGTDSGSSGVITSADGDILDGDGDGAPGGDYQIHYTCADIDPYWCR